MFKSFCKRIFRFWKVLNVPLELKKMANLISKLGNCSILLTGSRFINESFPVDEKNRFYGLMYTVSENLIINSIFRKNDQKH
jgi:hypothetical protein